MTVVVERPPASYIPADRGRSYYQPRAWARRLISVLRPWRRASIGVPGSDSSGVKSQLINSSSVKPESPRTVMVPLRLSMIRPSRTKAAGTERTLRWPTRISTIERSSNKRCTSLMETPSASARSGNDNHSVTSLLRELTLQECHNPGPSRPNTGVTSHLRLLGTHHMV